MALFPKSRAARALAVLCPMLVAGGGLVGCGGAPSTEARPVVEVQPSDTADQIIIGDDGDVTAVADVPPTDPSATPAGRAIPTELPAAAGPPPSAPYVREIDPLAEDLLGDGVRGDGAMGDGSLGNGLLAGGLPAEDAGATGEPSEPELQPGMDRKTFDQVDGAARVSFDDLDLLKVLGVDRAIPLDVAKHYPDWLAALDGRRVRLRGFMYPTYEPTGLTGFLLARDNEICCFGRDPLAYDILPVRMAAGETTDYIEGRPFDVEGVFHVEPEADGDELWQLFYLTDAKVLR